MVMPKNWDPFAEKRRSRQRDRLRLARGEVTPGAAPERERLHSERPRVQNRGPESGIQVSGETWGHILTFNICRRPSEGSPLKSLARFSVAWQSSSVH